MGGRDDLRSLAGVAAGWLKPSDMDAVVVMLVVPGLVVFPSQARLTWSLSLSCSALATNPLPPDGDTATVYCKVCAATTSTLSEDRHSLKSGWSSSMQVGVGRGGREVANWCTTSPVGV